MIKKLNEISLEFEKRLINNNIRGYALTIDVENLNNTMRTNAMFSQGEQNTGVMSFQLRLNELPVSLLEGTTVYANIVNKDVQLYHPCEIIDNELGIVLIRFKSQAIKTNGTHTLELVIQYSENEKLICPKVQYEVFASLDINISEPAEDELSLIQGIISDVKNLNSEVTSKESIRESSENSRIETELLRVDSEGKRAENELSRVASEEIRIETEKTRINDESIRKSSESTRVENEITRIESEENRKTSEIARANSEKLRTQEELTRKNNESSRIKAESIRQETYTNFNSAEVNRKENEALRVSSEEDRKNKESARNTAETKRVDVEKTRVNNESTRINSEALRKSAEVNRVDSENSRVEAEKVREIRFEEMAGSSQLSEITKEVREARSDYFGKEYPTLKEKEDAEYERVHIDNSKGMYMPTSSNTGAIKVENSIEGKTKDLKVNGRTLQNIISNSKINYVLNSVKVDNEITFNGGSISHYWFENNLFKENTTYTIILNRKIETGAVNRIFIDSWETPIYANVNIECSDGLFIATFKTKSRNDSVQGGWKNNLIKFVRNGNSTGSFTIDDIVIIEGDHTENPATSYFEGIKSLGEEENEISILSTGKNLFSSKENTTIDTDTLKASFLDNKFKLTTKGFFGYLLLSDILKIITPGDEVGRNLILVSGESYTLSINVLKNVGDRIVPFGVRDKTNTMKHTVNTGTQKSVSFIGSSDLSYVYVYLQPGVDLDLEFTLQIEAGTQVTQHEKHQQDKKDILLPVTNGAKGLPSGVCDEVMANGDYLKKIKKIDLGKISSSMVSLSWGETDTLIGFNIQTDEVVGIKTYGSTAISNLLPYTEYQVLTTKNYEWFSYNSTNKVLCIKILKNKLKTADINGIVEYLNSTSMCIYGELEEYILHKASVPTNNNLATFKEITHLVCTNKIAPSNIYGKFPINLPQKLVSLDKENQNLKTDLNTLKNNYTSLITELNMFKTQVLPYLNGEVTGE